jgi:acetyl esterase/lipase
MKKLVVFFIYFICFNTILISKGMTEDIVITGVIYNPKNPHIMVNKQSVELNDKGQFRYILTLKEAAYIEVNYGQSLYLYFKSGDRLHLDIDAEKGLNAIEVSGNRPEINQHLIRESAESAKVTNYFNKNFTELVKLEENKYVEKINDLWQPFKDRFDTFVREHHISDPYFIKTQQAMMRYSWADILMRYPDWHRQITRNGAFQPSEHFYDFIDQMDLNDPELLDIEEYQNFLKRVLEYKSDKLLNKRKTWGDRNYQPFRAKMQVCLETFTDPEIRSEMLYSFMLPLIKDYYHKGINDLIQTFEENCTNQDYLDRINTLIQNDKIVRDKCKIIVYKTIHDITLDAFLYNPSNIKPGDRWPAVAFFHGGGWECGKPEWGQMQCEHFSSLGLVAISFEYRLSTQHGATPVECMADAKSAIRWMREHAEELGIDPTRIVASGFSAGGHIALCTAMINGFDEPGEDLSIRSAADAFMLWVTPAKIFDDGWFKQLLKNKAPVKDCDPDSHIRSGIPPIVFFQGTADDTVPPWSIKAFAKKMKAVGNRCDLHMYEGQTHLSWGENALDVLEKMDAFLASLGYIQHAQ